MLSFFGGILPSGTGGLGFFGMCHSKDEQYNCYPGGGDDELGHGYFRCFPHTSDPTHSTRTMARIPTYTIKNGLRSWRRPLGLDDGPQQAVTRPREGLKPASDLAILSYHEYQGTGW